MTDQELLAIVEERQKGCQERDGWQAAIDNWSAEIGAELIVRGVTKVDLGEWSPQLVEGTRSTLNKTKLVDLGVTIEQIQGATETTYFSQLRVNRRGEGNGG